MRKLIIWTLVMLMAVSAHAINVVNTAGSLSDRVTDLNARTMSVSGTMNALDFYFMADNMKQLETVDLTDVQVVACDEHNQRYWQAGFLADELPICAFSGMNVVNVKLPATLKAIGKAAFAGCTALTDITWPTALDSIAEYAFAGCSSLVTVTLPSSVREVGEGAFMRCSSLTSFVVRSSSRLTHLAATALMDCPSLKTLALGSNMRSIGERALAGSGFDHLDLSANRNLLAVDNWAFVLSPVRQVTLPSSVVSVGEGAFLYDTELTDVTLGGTLSTVSDYMLAGTALNGNLDLTGVRRLGDYALYNVSQLSVVELPATVTWLGTRAMAGMTGLTALTSNAVNVPALGQEVWAGVPQKRIPLTVPAESLDQYKAAEQWMEFYFGSSWLRGDVNNDGEVNIADINMLIDIVLGGVHDSDTMRRADVNEDGEINIADINTVIDIILTPKNHMPAVIDINDALHMADVTLQPGEQRTLTVTLDNAEAYSGLQCDIVLPQGLTLVKARAAQGQVTECRDLGTGTSRLVMYAMDQRHFDGDALLQITVMADDDLALDSRITLGNIVLADESTGWHAADCMAQVTNSSGVENLTADADRVWVERNILCIEAHHDGTAQVVAVNGVTRNVEVTAGVTRHVLDKGFYVVVLNGKSYKIAIR